jgi:hypothetical protein
VRDSLFFPVLVSLLTCCFAGDFGKAAQLCPDVFGQDAKAWEEEVFTFMKHNQLQVSLDYVRYTGFYYIPPKAIIPVVPKSNPQLSKIIYEVILAHFLARDRDVSLTIGLTLEMLTVGFLGTPENH